uniref:Polyhedrin n=1 Tax=Simulium ubiquitum cypovirus TaxID=397545 RepID=Q0MX25_9REOV|nr:polyhedrin [Simulium ubiquitum cypovirus]
MSNQPFNQPNVLQERQHLVNRQLVQGPNVQDAIKRVAIIFIYKNGSYRLIDYNAPEFINGYFNWRDMLYMDKPAHSNRHKEFENQIRRPDHGDSHHPELFEYPVAIMISANGNICWENVRVEVENEDCLNHEDWRRARAWGPRCYKGSQMMKCSALGRFLYIPLRCQNESLKFKFPSRMSGGDNRYSSHSIGQVIQNNIIIRNNPLYLDNEGDLIDYMQAKNLCYIDSAAVVDCNGLAGDSEC